MSLNRRRAVIQVANVVVGLTRGGKRVGTLSFDMRQLGREGKVGFALVGPPAASGTAYYVQRTVDNEPECWGFDCGRAGLFELRGLFKCQLAKAGQGRAFVSKTEWDDATVARKARGQQSVTWNFEKMTQVTVII